MARAERERIRAERERVRAEQETARAERERLRAELGEREATTLAEANQRLADDERAARTTAERIAADLRSQVARNHFALGLADYDAGRWTAGLASIGQVLCVSDPHTSFHNGVRRVLLDRVAQYRRTFGTPLHYDDQLAAIFSPDGTRLLTLTSSNMDVVQLWDVKFGVPIWKPMYFDERTWDAVFSPDGTKILTGGGFGAQFWDSITGSPIGDPLPRSDWAVLAVSFNQDGTQAITGTAECLTQRWDVATGLPLSEPMKHKGPMHAVKFNLDGTRMFSESFDGKGQIWDTATGASLGDGLRQEGVIRFSVFSPDGSRLATRNETGTTRLWDAATGLPLREPLEHEGPVYDVKFSADGTRALRDCPISHFRWPFDIEMVPDRLSASAD